MRIRFTVAYDGTGFCGWQRQNHGPRPSLQQVLEEALSRLFQEKVVLFASGRTDAGVHAMNQVCHFNISDHHSKRLESWDLTWALRSLVPPSIVVKKAWIAPDDFHATLSATHKTYRYFIYNNSLPDPFWSGRSGWVRHPLDLSLLNEYSQVLMGEHDFKSFQSAGTPVATTVREIFQARWQRRSSRILEFAVTGEGFLKQMVRNIVGTQLQLHKEGQPPAEMRRILRSLDRTQVAAPAAPQGLFLWRVYYPRELDKRCRPLYTREFANWSQHEDLHGKK